MFGFLPGWITGSVTGGTTAPRRQRVGDASRLGTHALRIGPVIYTGSGGGGPPPGGPALDFNATTNSFYLALVSAGGM